MPGLRESRRKARRRRLSVAHLDDGAIEEAKSKTKSASSKKKKAASPGTPSKQLGKNDDEAEKRRARRNSVHRRRNSVHGISIQGGGRRRRKSLGPEIIVPKMDQISLANMYSDVVGQSQRNKINKKNAWGLNLINYMSDVIKMQEKQPNRGGGMAMTDFARASHTIDAAAKIYGARVDSVHTESYKVLGSINHDDPEAGGAAVVVGLDGQKKVVRRARTATSTLVTTEARLKDINLASISDVCNHVDPMFHKTASAFDEGGSKGLLMNQLGVMNGCSIAFDSAAKLCTDTSPLPEDMPKKNEKSQEGDGDANMGDAEAGKDDTPPLVSEPPEHADCLKVVWDRIAANYREQSSCPGLQDFREQIGGIYPLDPKKETDEFGMPSMLPADNDANMSMQAADDDGGNFDFDDDDGGFDGGFDGGDFDLDDNVGNDMDDQARVEEEMMRRQIENDEDPSDSNSGQAQVLLNQTMNTMGTNKSFVSVIESVDLDTFVDMRPERGMGMAWAGPDHWNYKRQMLTDRFNDKKDGKPRQKKKKKPIEWIQYADIIDEQGALKEECIAEELFAPPRRPNHKHGPLLSEAAQVKHCATYNQLPNDLHLEARMFARLFNRKKRRVVNKREVMREANNNAEDRLQPGDFASDYHDQDNPLNESWVAPLSDNDDFGDDMAGGHWDDDMSDEENQPPFQRNQSFMQWGDEDVGFNFGNFKELQDAPRIANSIKVDYVVKAKKIDVKRLKVNMWDCIGRHHKAKAKKSEPEDSAEANAEEPDSTPTDTAEQVTFQNAIDNICAKHPKEQVDNLSVAFCFMCVLHLANERNLSFEHAKDAFMGDFNIRMSNEERQAVIAKVNQSMALEKNTKQSKLAFKKGKGRKKKS